MTDSAAANELRAFRSALRSRLIAAREALPADIHAQLSRKMERHLGELLDALNPAVLAFCWPFRAEFDAMVVGREVRSLLGFHAWPRFIDLATVLPALFPATENDSLDDWVAHFGLPPIGRHHAIADAYATAQLLMIVLEAAPRFGIETAADLRDAEVAQRWLGRRR